MNTKSRQIKDAGILLALGYPLILLMALKSAPYLIGGILSVIANIPQMLKEPFALTFSHDSLRAVFLFSLIYLAACCFVIESIKNYRRTEEHGSAKWGNARRINAKYKSKNAIEDKLLTRNVRISLSTHRHRRNLNTLVVGGSGSGKTRFYAKPNLMQANTSFVVLDPKGELLASTGNLLKEKGYDIKVLDLINMDKSFCYNPFAYITGENDIMRLVTNIIKNTTPKNTSSADPFWDKSEIARSKL